MPRPRKTTTKTVCVPRLKEAEIQRQCVDFMRLDGWRPLQTDPCSDKSRGKGFGEEGMADHLFIRYPLPTEVRYHKGEERAAKVILSAFEFATLAMAQVLWVEFKRPAGLDAAGIKRAATKLTIHQRLWHEAERAQGAMTARAGFEFEPSFEGFTAWYRKSGLLRREGL